MDSSRHTDSYRVVLARSILVTGLLLLAGCGQLPGNGDVTVVDPRSGPSLMADVTSAVGLDFVHRNGMTGELYYSEVIGAGGALFDADNDGDLDLYLVQGGPLERREQADLAQRPGDRLWRNDLSPGPDGLPKLSFTDVTIDSGITADLDGFF